MGDRTGISWADATWNVTSGCAKISPGCQHCYAEQLHTLRHKAYGEGKQLPALYEKPFGVIQTHPERLDIPLRWRRPRRIFVDSMSDLFHGAVPDAFLDRVFGVMAAASRHLFLVLTKRPERMAEYLSDPETKYRIWDAARPLVERVTHRSMYDVVPVAKPGAGPDWCYPAAWPAPNIWGGTTVEDQDRAVYRIPFLVRAPLAHRFLSYEPAIGSLDLYSAFGGDTPLPCKDGCSEHWCAWPACVGHEAVEWLICGGESGKDARPMHPAWARSVREQCRDMGIEFHFKQWGEWQEGSSHMTWPKTEHKVVLTTGTAYDPHLWTAGVHIPEGADRPVSILDPQMMARVGKAAAGRHLDGAVWDAMPIPPGAVAGDQHADRWEGRTWVADSRERFPDMYEEAA